LNVTTGQTVKIGDVIGTVGSTGNSTGAHLHLEILKGNAYINPIFFMNTASYNLTPT
jgi:murein DD-endopeptidase MepM/ murein hydrolase activator NlpD